MLSKRATPFRNEHLISAFYLILWFASSFALQFSILFLYVNAMIPSHFKLYHSFTCTTGQHDAGSSRCIWPPAVLPQGHITSTGSERILSWEHHSGQWLSQTNTDVKHIRNEGEICKLETLIFLPLYSRAKSLSSQPYSKKLRVGTGTACASLAVSADTKVPGCPHWWLLSTTTRVRVTNTPMWQTPDKGGESAENMLRGTDTGKHLLAFLPYLYSFVFKGKQLLQPWKKKSVTVKHSKNSVKERHSKSQSLMHSQTTTLLSYAIPAQLIRLWELPRSLIFKIKTLLFFPVFQNSFTNSVTWGGQIKSIWK